MSESKYRFNRVKRQPAYKIVANELLNAVVRRELKPGDSLPIESDLAEQFGVNRSTVREGIRYLEQTGLVTRRGKKLVVSKPPFEKLGDQVSMALVVHDVTFQEMWEVKMALEPLATRLACEKMRPEKLELLEANLAATEKALGRREDLVILDLEFHEIIVDIADNKPPDRCSPVNRTPFLPCLSGRYDSGGSGQRMLAAHRNIFDAIKNDDAETAAEWMRKHVVDFKRGYILAGLDVNTKVPLVRLKRFRHFG